MIDFRLTPLLLSLSFFLSLFPLDNGNLSTVYPLDERGQMIAMNECIHFDSCTSYPIFNGRSC
jgi:hypothetical protein